MRQTIKEEVRNKRALKKRHETRGEARREDGEEWWRRKKEKQAGGEMKRDKR